MEKKILKDLYALKEEDLSICTSIDDVLKVIKDDCLLMEEDKISMLEALKGNNKDIFVIKIQNIFNVFSYEDYSWIEDDNVLLDEEIDLVCEYLLYYNKMMGILNEENFRDIYKLVNFTSEYYASNLEHLEDMRDAVNFSSRGIGYCSGSGSNTRDEFREFFNEEFSRVSLIKPVQKTI